MAVSAAEVYALKGTFAALIVGISFLAAALIWKAPPARPLRARDVTLRRILALCLFAWGTYHILAIGEMLPGPTDLRGDLWWHWKISMMLWVNLATWAVLLLIAGVPRLRSGWGLLYYGAGAVLFAGLLLWLFAKGVFVPGYHDGPLGGEYRRAFWVQVTVRSFSHETLLGTLMVATLWRARSLQETKRRAVETLAPLLLAPIPYALGLRYGQIAAATWRGDPLSPLRQEFVARQALYTPPVPMLGWTLLAFLVMMSTVLVYLCYRRRWGFALVTLFGFLLALLPFTGDSYITVNLVIAVAAVYVVFRDGLAGGFAMSPRTRLMMAGVLFASVTLAVISHLFWIFDLSPFAGSLVTLGGVAAGIVVFMMFLPEFRGRLVTLGAPGAAAIDARIEVYRLAMEDAIESGKEQSLASMRGRLGISDREHAILAQGAALGGMAALVEGSLFLDRFRVVRRLGRGGTGDAWLCHDERVGRDIVVKRLHTGDPEMIAREARALGRLRHPNVVTLYQFERVGNIGFLVLEYAENGSLADRTAEGAPSPSWPSLALELLDALQTAHDAGILHRDISPGNVLLTADGTPKLADFGIASMPDGNVTLMAPSGGGTLRYLAPERAAGGPATRQADIYALAATLYEALTGLRHEAAHDGRPAEFDAPLQGYEDLRPWFQKALHPRPALRYRTARDMARGLQRLLPRTATARPRRSWLPWTPSALHR